MARKNITDKQVCEAYEKAWYGDRWPYDYLSERTRECKKVCYRAMERAHKRGLVDYGVSLRAGWLTEKGKALLHENKQEE